MHLYLDDRIIRMFDPVIIELAVTSTVQDAAKYILWRRQGLDMDGVVCWV